MSTKVIPIDRDWFKETRMPSKRPVRFGLVKAIPEVAGLPSFMTPKEVATVLKVSIDVVRGLIQRKELRAQKVGHQWRVTRSAVAELLMNAETA